MAEYYFNLFLLEHSSPLRIQIPSIVYESENYTQQIAKANEIGLAKKKFDEKELDCQLWNFFDEHP
jgi:hypothetical protein